MTGEDTVSIVEGQEAQAQILDGLIKCFLDPDENYRVYQEKLSELESQAEDVGISQRQLKRIDVFTFRIIGKPSEVKRDVYNYLIEDDKIFPDRKMRLAIFHAAEIPTDQS